ncbi:hypothetical protein [Kordiimonas aquimaris]|uniref:hypothetical protein n=1 Tax=Kordiimonas aquimaris TaxID=707591 RepID=UPI0021CE8FF1|nr:hypothetical protein [Kordiimonas aquimaris]
MKPDKKPPPTLTELLAVRSAIWDDMFQMNDLGRDSDKMMNSFFQTCFAIDDMLAVQIKSANAAAKWLKEEIAMLNAKLEDMQEVQS